MNKVKATNSLTLKKILAKQHPDLEKKLHTGLSTEVQSIYDYATVSTWITDAQEKEILERGAGLLFPDHSQAMVDLGRQLALETMGGLYRVFLRIPSVSFIIKRTANLWRLFNASGNAQAEESGPGVAAIIITEATHLQKYQCDLVTGYIRAVLELTQAKNVSVIFAGGNPEAWRWDITWNPQA